MQRCEKTLKWIEQLYVGRCHCRSDTNSTCHAHTVHAHRTHTYDVRVLFEITKQWKSIIIVIRSILGNRNTLMARQMCELSLSSLPSPPSATRVETNSHTHSHTHTSIICYCIIAVERRRQWWNGNRFTEPLTACSGLQRHRRQMLAIRPHKL